MGEKTQARALAKKAGVPLLPGTVSAVPNVEEALKAAEGIGYPVILKAAAGGGKDEGIHIVRSPEQLQASFDRVSARQVQLLVILQCMWRNTAKRLTY